MKKIAFLLCLCLGCGLMGQAQISTGESTAQTIRTGNRAEKGDFGLYLGATTTMFQNIGSDTDFKALPLINFKYMVTDKIEARLGFEWWSKTDSNTEDPEDGAKSTMSHRETNIMFYPGIAYHFNRSNILDVYVGGELPIGGGANGDKATYDGEDVDGVESSTRFEIGLGAFIGLQAYICNLPLAIGVEYGVNVRNVHVGNGKITSSDGLTYEPVKDHSSNRFTLGNQARLTLTYFFKL